MRLTGKLNLTAAGRQRLDRLYEAMEDAAYDAAALGRKLIAEKVIEFCPTEAAEAEALCKGIVTQLARGQEDMRGTILGEGDERRFSRQGVNGEQFAAIRQIVALEAGAAGNEVLEHGSGLTLIGLGKVSLLDDLNRFSWMALVKTGGGTIEERRQLSQGTWRLFEYGGRVNIYPRARKGSSDFEQRFLHPEDGVFAVEMIKEFEPHNMFTAGFFSGREAAKKAMIEHIQGVVRSV